MTKHWPLFVLLICFGFLFWSLLSSHMLQIGPAGLYSGGSTWADLAFHMAITSSFQEQGFSATLASDPTFAGHKLSYPFGADLLTAWLVKAGLSIQSALIWPSFLAILAVVGLIYFLVFQMVRSRVAAALAPVLFFFNGSVVGLYYFWRDWMGSQQSFWRFLQNMPEQYAHLHDHNIELSNLIADFILPQRVFAFGLLLGIPAVYFLWRYWNERQNKYLLRAGLLVAFLPLLHAHSFLTLNLAGLCLVLVQVINNRSNIKSVVMDWVWFALPVALIGLPQLWIVLPQGGSGFFRAQIGWLSGEDGFGWFWLKNLGVYLPVIIWGWFLASVQFRRFYLAFAGLFVLANIFVFQPYDWDNTKFFVWWFLLSTPLIGLALARAWQKNKLLAIGLVCLITVVGSLSIYRETTLHWLLFSQEDLALADFIKKETPQDAIFLTPDNHNNPVASLAGRQILMGYPGWLWSHGIDYVPRERDIKNIYSTASRSLIDQYGISYILTTEKTTPFSYDLIFTNSKYNLYKIK